MRYSVNIDNTMWCRYDAVNFIQSPHKRHPTPYVLHQLLQWCMQYHVILNRVITTLDCTMILISKDSIFMFDLISFDIGFRWISCESMAPQITSSWGQHGAMNPCWPHEPCYQGHIMNQTASCDEIDQASVNQVYISEADNKYLAWIETRWVDIVCWRGLYDWSISIEAK